MEAAAGVSDATKKEDVKAKADEVVAVPPTTTTETKHPVEEEEDVPDPDEDDLDDLDDLDGAYLVLTCRLNRSH